MCLYLKSDITISTGCFTADAHPVDAGKQGPQYSHEQVAIERNCGNDQNINQGKTKCCGS